MSYDLFFRSRSPDRSISHSQFVEYFRGRDRFQVKKAQAFYSNECTGNYFLFEYSESGSEDDGLLPITFNLNYFRPHVFGLEAEPELHAFVDEFDLLVSDPQNEGMGNGEYSGESFLSGWNAGNDFSHNAILSQHGAEAVRFSLPGDVIERCWTWNKERDSRQAEVGQEFFVPRIFFLEHEGEARSAVIWGDAIPIAIPEIDVIVMARHELAPRGLLWRKKDHSLVPYSEVAALLAGFPEVTDPIPHQLLRYTDPPKQLVDFFRGLPPGKTPIPFISFDEVLTHELVAKHMPKEDNQ